MPHSSTTRDPSRALRIATLTAALLAAMVTCSAIFAATTSADPTCGTKSKLCLETTHSPADVTFVSPGSLVTYTVTVSNPGTSTATKVVLTDKLPAGATLAVDDATQKPPLPSNCSSGPDPQDPTRILITCSLGSVKPTGSNPRVFDFTFQMPTVDGSTTNTASITADARANDSGNNPNDPTQETFSDTELVNVQTVEDLASSAVPNGLRLRVNTDYDNSGATLGDPLTAKFNILSKFVPPFSTTALIDDDVPDAGFVCPSGLKCPTGGWVQGVVPGPLGRLDPFSPPSEFKIEIRHDASQIPPGLTESKYVLLHDWDYDPATKDYEQIKRRCSSNAPPCINDVRKLADGDFLVTAEVTGNFRWR